MISSIVIARGAFDEIYEPAWVKALEQLGVKVTLFDSHAYTLPGILGRVERKFLWGPGIYRIRRELLKTVSDLKPDVTLLYQGQYFGPDIVKELRKYSFVTGYHNDDPFGPRRGMLRYRLLHKALSSYQGYHVYRQHNLADAAAFHIPHVSLMKPYYIPWLDFPREGARQEGSKWGCDVVFAGHAEPDIRVEALVKASQNPSWKVRIYGHLKPWERILAKEDTSRLSLNPAALGDDYRQALCGARIATCFFSRWNRDVYTRRVFEIPACGAFLLCERTAAMQELYIEGKEAEYFSSVEEFLEKVDYYLLHESERIQIAAQGYERAMKSGYDVVSRMRQWLAEVDSWKGLEPQSGLL